MSKNEGGILRLFSQSFLICQDKICDKGEDSYLLNVNENAAFFGVFDGCGGIGSRIYQEYGNRTGAYIASRAVSSTLADWFLEWSESASGREPEAEIRERIDCALQAYSSAVESRSMLKGNMKKEFPTTLACGIAGYDSGRKRLTADFIWCGDSRGFSLDAGGLHQWTKDDVYRQDAMSNIRNDGALTNVVSASHAYELHSIRGEWDAPVMLFAATDGCYEYPPSPMHFEYVLLNCLQISESLAEWEDRVKREIGACAGDDFTLCGGLFGFENYAAVQAYYRARGNQLQRDYIDRFSRGDDKNNLELWEQYRTQYEVNV